MVGAYSVYFNLINSNPMKLEITEMCGYKGMLNLPLIYQKTNDISAS